MMRPAMSAPEPAVSGTISRIARVGYSCAPAQVDTVANSRAAAIRRSALMTTSGGRDSLSGIMRKASRHCHVHFVTCIAKHSRRGGGSAMKRIVAALLLLISSDAARAEFSVVEATIADMQQAMANGRVTSREL